MAYVLEKKVWTEADFDRMGWLDNPIYKMSVAGDLMMDIDYILKWNPPDYEGLPFTYWIAPATLVFKDISQLQFELMSSSSAFTIEDIEREEPDHWTIITLQGNLQFNARRYEQYIRQAPSYQFSQAIPYFERHGYSLEKTTDQANPHLLRAEVIQQRERNFEYYEDVKKRHLQRLELQRLMKAREHNEIDKKEYFSKKAAINDIILSYDYALKGSEFEGW